MVAIEADAVSKAAVRATMRGSTASSVTLPADERLARLIID